MLIFVLKCVVGLVVLSLAADYLIKSSVAISKRLSISPLIVGLTVVAFGTSAPELSVSLIAALKGQGEIAIGNVVGSNIFNLLVIVGLSAALRPIIVHRQLLRFDLPVMAGVTLLASWMVYNGRFQIGEGLILLSLLALYIGAQIQMARKAGPETKEVEIDTPEPDTWMTRSMFLTLVVWIFSLGFLILGSRWFVEGASGIALAFGVSELIVGLTLIAFGTSLPEVATSVAAAIKGQGDLAIGNAVGSNIFNILCVLGVSSTVAPGVLQVSPEIISRDLPFLLATSMMVFPLFWTHNRLDRWEGGILIAVYGFYAYVLYLATTGSRDFYESVVSWSLFLGAPLLIVFLFIHALKRRKKPS